tara:strand:- start:151 stop:1524 length:1374 start_codon:yes stop_codon:yes gene_type:complete
MSLKIGSKVVIFDSAYNGPDTGGMFGQYDSSANRLESVSSGHNLYFNNSTQVVEITPPEITYSSGVSNIILNLKNTDTNDNAIQHMFLKINGNRQVKGYKKATGSDIGYYTPTEFNSSNRGAAQALDISADGLNWYLGHNADDKIYHYTNTVPWGVSTISLSSSFDHSAYYANKDSSGGREYRGLRVSEDGEKMYVMTGNSLYNIHTRIDQFSLSTPYSLSSVTHDSSFSFKIPMKSPFSSVGFYGDIDSTNNNITQLFDFDRDGKRVLVANNEGNRTAVLRLDDAWDLSKVRTETLGKYSDFVNVSYQFINECRLDKDGKTARVYKGTTVGSSYAGLLSWDWKHPWQLLGSFDSTFEERPSETPNSGSRIYKSFHMRPGGHHFIGLLSYVLGDRLYKINTQDSATSSEIAELAFPPNVNFENGYQPDFPDSGEALWLEMLSFDSGNNWYAKKMYGG